MNDNDIERKGAEKARKLQEELKRRLILLLQDPRTPEPFKEAFKENCEVIQ